MSKFRIAAFATLAACQLALAVPQLNNCHFVGGGVVECDISGESADIALKFTQSGGLELAFPGYYLNDHFTDHPTLTKTQTTYAATFTLENAGSAEIVKRLTAQVMLTKSTFANFEGKLRLNNIWSLMEWTNL